MKYLILLMILSCKNVKSESKVDIDKPNTDSYDFICYEIETSIPERRVSHKHYLLCYNEHEVCYVDTGSRSCRSKNETDVKNGLINLKGR